MTCSKQMKHQTQFQALYIQQQKKQPLHNWRVNLFFPQIMSQRTCAKVVPDICIDRCKQSLIDFHAATRVPGKILLLKNDLYDQGFNEHIFHLKKNPPQVNRNAHLSGCRGLKLLSSSQYSCQDFCHSYVRSSYIWLNELWSRKLSHLTHLNAILKSPLLQIYCTKS